MFNKKRIKELEGKIEKFEEDMYVKDEFPYTIFPALSHLNDTYLDYAFWRHRENDFELRKILKAESVTFRRIIEDWGSSHIAEFLTHKNTYKICKPQIDEWEKDCREFERRLQKTSKNK